MAKEKKKKLKKMVLIIMPLLILYYLSSGYFVNEIYYYSSSKSITSLFVYGLIIFTSLLVVIFTIWGFILIKKNKFKKCLWFLFLIISIIM
ncbi:MAG: hypothetical protein RSA10_03660, partial [Bacilli bacterium]